MVWLRRVGRRALRCFREALRWHAFGVTLPLVEDRLGRPLRDLRISVIDECNFRCTYCMPRELFAEGHPFLAPSALLSFDEIETVVRIGARLGVNKVKITGGEPLLRPGVHRLIERLNNIRGIEDVGLITNGYHLPRLAGWLRAAGLKRITISLDSARPETFAKIADRSTGLDQVIAGIDRAKECGFAPIKLNMVVQRGVNDAEVVEMARFARDRGLELRYIEYMDVGRRHDFRDSLLVPNREIRDTLDAEFGLEPLEPDFYGEVAQAYRYKDTGYAPGGERVGFISSMTVPFCGSCTRLRLSADGKMYRCLFSGLGLDIRKLLRRGVVELPGEAGRDTVSSGRPVRTVPENRPAGTEGTDARSSETPDGKPVEGSKSAPVEEQLESALRKFWGVREDRYSELRAGGDISPDSEQENRVEMYRMGG